MKKRIVSLSHVGQNIFYVRNDTKELFEGLWIKPSGSDNWGDNQLSDVIKSGAAHPFAFVQSISVQDNYDIMILTANNLTSGISFRKLNHTITKGNTVIIQDSDKDYLIGDKGPAGGMIFYDKVSYADGWRYLEAAPAETEFEAEWGGYDFDIFDTLLTIGSGKENTKKIAEFLNYIGETSRAAQICAELDINGYKDWFLPSKDELNEIYINLVVNALGDFQNDWYFTSSQYFSFTVWDQCLNSIGLQFSSYKNEKLRVRAIRSF